MPSIQYSKFVVNESPYTVWEWDLKDRNITFITNFDSAYFEYLAQVHSQGLEIDEQKQWSALALRTAYSHGLETLFAFLFAALQAPDCVVGWLHKYDVGDLKALIKKVQTRQPIMLKLEINPITWKSISNVVLSPLCIEDKEKEQGIKQRFAILWGRLADYFVADVNTQEYNSIKHGFRVKAGGFRLAMGKEDVPGIRPPADRMRSLGGSEFGSLFYVPERIGDNKLNFRIKRHARNWRPENFIYGLHMILISLQNIISFLQIINGAEATTVQFTWPSDESYFDRPWQSISGPTGISMDSIITPNHIKSFDKNDILDIYNVDDAGSHESDAQE
jgi:hypothetical protein